MSRSRMLGILVVAAVALATGFLVAGQVGDGKQAGKLLQDGCFILRHLGANLS